MTTIYQSTAFTINSIGNGAAYEITRHDGASVFIQYGGDGAAFREQFDAIDAQESPIYTIDDLCAEYF